MVELNHDILSRIFTLISNDLHGSSSVIRVDTIRSCSQVCSNWRNLLLESPAIWGRLLVLRESQGMLWFVEVMKRAQSSPLWINTSLTGVDANIVSLEDLVSSEDVPCKMHAISLCLLFHHQHNVFHRLEVFSGSGVWPAVLFAAFKLCVYTHKAPLLRVFEFNVFSTAANTEDGTEVLFSGEAPLLHTFNSIEFPLRPSSWMANLRHLRFYPPNAFALLNLLEGTPLLEDLEIESISTTQTIMRTVQQSLTPTISVPYVTLPRLQRIKGRLPLIFFGKFFSQLTFSQHHCDISLRLDADSEFIQTEQLGLELEHALDRLITQSKGFSGAPYRGRLSLSVSENTMYFSTSTFSVEVETNPALPLIAFRQTTRDALAAVLDSLTPHVDDITDLDLDSYSNLDPSTRVVPSFRRLLKQAVLVKTLALSPQALSFLFKESDSKLSTSSSSTSSEFFPCLETISMSSFSFESPPKQKDDAFLSTLQSFIRGRADISTFIVRGQSEEMFISVRDCLDGIDECMKVEWRQTEPTLGNHMAHSGMFEEEMSDAMKMLMEVMKL